MDSVRVDGMAARNVVPQTAEPRGFLRRRKTDEPAPPSPPSPVVEAQPPVIAMSVLVPVAAPAPVAVRPPVEPVHVDVEPLLAAAPVEAPAARESDELFRAQAALLQAALRQADELTAALAHEQQLRLQETARLTAENQLLRDALATLNAQALERQQEVAAAPSLEQLLPEQPLPLDDVQRHGRRRSAREAGPA